MRNHNKTLRLIWVGLFCALFAVAPLNVPEASAMMWRADIDGLEQKQTGVMKNAGHAGLSYVVNDQPGPRRRIVHLFNHNFTDYKIVPQKGVALTIPSRHPVKEVFLVSPDLPEKTSRRPVAFTWRDGVLRCRIDIAYYNVIVLEPR